MGKETVLFSSEERTDSRQAAAFLHHLVDNDLPIPPMYSKNISPK